MTPETPSVQTIRDYLLGQLPESETERLDELSIADDECAERIRAVEHDLADGFARGELEGAVLEQFRSRYLTTPRRREATRFAEALQSLDENSGLRSPEAGRGPTTPPPEKRRWRESLALAAAILLSIATVSLVLDNRTLRERATSAELERNRQLVEAEARRPADTARPPTVQQASPLTIATLVLAPQLRSARQLPTVTLAGGTGNLAVQLELEPVDYPTYRGRARRLERRPDRVAVGPADRPYDRRPEANRSRPACDKAQPTGISDPRVRCARSWGFGDRRRVPVQRRAVDLS